MINKIHNISSSYNFLKSLHSWIINNFQNLSTIKVILPNRRSCNELKLIFQENNFCGFLPQIKSLSDIDIEDFSEYLENDEELFMEILNAQKMDPLEAVFFISNQIKKLDIFGKINFEQSCKIAIKIQEIFDEIEFEQINLAKLNEINDINLSLHRQVTLEFIKDFYTQTKANLIKNNLYFSSAYQNFIIDKYYEILQNKKPEKTIIIAGSTGSLNCGKKLIKAISQLKNGHVVFNNLEISKFKNLNENIYANDPQFFNILLLKFLEINHNQVNDIKISKHLMSSQFRKEFISELTKINDQIISWQNFINHPNINEIKNDIIDNFMLIEANNIIDEAMIIADIIAKNYHKNNHGDYNIAIICNNQQLQKTIEYSLQTLDISYNNTNAINITNNSLILFIINILQLLESDFNSYQLLSIFKHQLFAFVDQQLISNFEIKILRQARKYSGLKGIIDSLKNDQELEIFFNNFLSILPKEKTIDSIILSIEKLANKTWDNIISTNDAGDEINLFFKNLLHLKYQISNASEFEFLCSQISYFQRDQKPNKSIKILSNIEARLLSFDLVILCGLNYGDFPQIIDDNWLGKQISRELGIDRQNKKIGQNAFDFSNYLTNPKVVLSRSIANADKAFIPSPFILKFKTLIQKINIFDFKIIKNYQENFPLITLQNPEIPSICVPLEYLPNKISITKISQLLNDPYSYYVDKILNINELNSIDYQPSSREFGSFVHKALEVFVENKNNHHKFLEIFNNYFVNIEARYTWYARFEKIFTNFLKFNNNFLSSKNLLEQHVNHIFKGIKIYGKIDRITIDDFQNFTIIDYKTGLPPSKKSVQNGIELQLTLSALLLEKSGICLAEKIQQLYYWQLGINLNNPLKKNIDDKISNLDLIKNTEQIIDQLITKYFIENKPFIANENTINSNIKNIARTEEWSK